MPRDLLAEVNALEIAKEELWEIASDLSASDRESPDAEPCFEAGFTTIARRTKKRRRRRAFAIWSRMEALARLVEDEGAPGWTLPQMPDGSILTHRAVFNAAAVHPLVERDGEWVFDRTSFLDRVLELAEPKATA